MYTRTGAAHEAPDFAATASPMRLHADGKFDKGAGGADSFFGGPQEQGTHPLARSE